MKTNRIANPIYEVWRNMRQRCVNPNRKDFKYYGGRGIRVCETWNSFDQFLADMGSSYRPGLELDRVNTDGHYEQSNCRWVSHVVNARNRRLQSNNKSGYRGVSWSKQHKGWSAQIHVFGYSPYLGHFSSAQAAARAYNEAALKYFGPTAIINTL